MDDLNTRWVEARETVGGCGIGRSRRHDRRSGEAGIRQECRIDVKDGVALRRDVLQAMPQIDDGKTLQVFGPVVGLVRENGKGTVRADANAIRLDTEESAI